jgi:uncharacterized protein YybS (DUF2232 family)
MEAGFVKEPSRVALVPTGKAAAITVVMGLCLAIFPLVPAILIPFLALPLAHVVARWSVLSGVVVAVVTGVLVYLAAGLGAGLLVFLLVLGMGMLIGQAARRRWSFGRSLASTAGAALAALVVWGTTLWLALGLDLTQLRESAYGSIEEAAALYAGMGVGSAATDSVSAQLRWIVDIVPYLTPGLLGMGAVLLAACSLGLAYVLFPRVRQKVAVGYSLSGFRMHWVAAYASIAGLAMLVFARGDGEWHTVVFYVGLNVLLVSQTLFFVQGLAVVRWFVLTRQLRPGSRTALYVAAVLGQALLQLTGLLGLFDTWLDYRKRFALKSPGAGSAR